MDDSKQDPKEEKRMSSSQIDLAELKSFSFGTQWSEASKSDRPTEARRGEGRRERGPRPGQPGKKDRRPPRAAGPSAGPPASADRRGDFKRASGEAPVRKHSDDRREEGRRGGDRRREVRSSGRGAPPPPPYESRVFEVGFYPEDACFTAIVKALRGNHLTYELFDIAQIFLEKPARYIASIRLRPTAEDPKPKTVVSAPDSFPFETEEEALRHVAERRADAFFDVEELEIDPPSGNFPFVSRCPFTKEVLGPPNYHRYEEILKRHHRSRLPNMPFEKLKSSMETVREEEAVNQWLESMRKATRYKTKVAEGKEPVVLESIEDVYIHLKTHLREEAVKTVAFARVPGSVLAENSETEAARAANGEIERQRRFPLETANAIRGRLRRERFAIYKKGSKGVTYVCAVKRRFRSPGEVLAEPLDRIVRFIEQEHGVKAKGFLEAFKAWVAEKEPKVALDEKKIVADLHWLIADGYVTHFSDDTLVAQPSLPDASKASAQQADSSKPQKASAKDEESGDALAGEKEDAKVVDSTSKHPETLDAESPDSEVSSPPEASAAEDSAKKPAEAVSEVASKAGLGESGAAAEAESDGSEASKPSDESSFEDNEANAADAETSAVRKEADAARSQEQS